MSNDATAVQGEPPPISMAAAQQALAAAQQDVAALNDKYLRAAAALDNARKQAEREVTTRVNQRLQLLILDMLDVVDSLERALSYSTPDTPLHTGLHATHQQLLAVLMQIPIGSPLDPMRHEAVGRCAAIEEQSAIVAVQRNGYLHDGQLLHPAQVIISDPGSVA